MRFHAAALLTGATAVAANTATLLLPGFQGHELQAGVLNSNGETTTYLVTCPKTVAAADCGILGTGMTAMAAPTTMSLVNADSKGNTASMGCNVAGTTYASCLAQEGTVTVSSTLNGKNLNFMPVTVTGPCSTSTPTPTPTPTSTSTITPTSTVTPTSTSTPVSSPKKSTTRPASSTRLVTSSASVSTGAITGTPLPSQSTAPASATPSAAGAVALAGNSWAFGGAALAMFYALA